MAQQQLRLESPYTRIPTYIYPRIDINSDFDSKLLRQRESGERGGKCCNNYRAKIWEVVQKQIHDFRYRTDDDIKSI